MERRVPSGGSVSLWGWTGTGEGGEGSLKGDTLRGGVIVGSLEAAVAGAGVATGSLEAGVGDSRYGSTPTVHEARAGEDEVSGT